MKNLFLAAGVAALALSLPAAADPGGKGNGNRGQSAKAERGGGGGDRARGERKERRAEGRAERRQERRAERRSERRDDRRAERSREQRQERRAERRSEQRDDRRAERVREQRQERRAERVREQRQDRRQERRAERVRDNRENRREFRADRNDRIRDRREDLRELNRDRRERLARLNDRDRDFRFRDFDDDRFERRFASRGFPVAFIDDCPPGLRTKNALCMPPGQYKKLVGQRFQPRYAEHALPRSLRDLYRDTDDYYYRYGDGYLYRVDRDEQLIRSVLPLIGAGLGIGMPFPYSSPSYYVPTTYQPFYQDSPYSYYRYANGYVYEIDRSSGMIEDIIPLLDHGYGVGQMLPASYSYYNVPYQYRDWYQDDDDYYYRYAPGAIYQVDQETRLITAIASLLTGSNGLAVGQPLPVGYDMYNVPFDYRDRYYDTPNSWYRYSNNRIYQVDPTTRLVTAVVDAIV